MTVCLAAVCEAGKKIISVTDQMIGFAEGGTVTTVDGAVVKDDHIHQNWFAMFASDDTTDVSPILDRAKYRMCQAKGQRSLSEAGIILQESYMLRHQDLIEFGVLKPLGFKDYDDFHQRAKDCLPESEHIRILQKIDMTAPQCTFLVGGFDPMEIGHLFQQECKAAWLGLDELGWWAIGSGQNEAIGALQWFAQNYGFSIPCSEGLAVYCLLAAKFMAEASNLVGRQTFVLSHSFSESVRWMPEYFVERIRAEWEHFGTGKISKLTIRNIPLMMKTHDELEELVRQDEKRIRKRALSKKRRSKKGE